ncbi:hypothetical protein PL321_01915 [Caloramator sp. mosi_1]|uniref:hypothetical protein n=1 Tax=Caloramator sp. mosi_1 TaxID=3023090 RepID=UPI0023606685|nr:hypothetical protein [Caloramator sp. mosi_1]WDC84528.1 hypothetical protein PL321_01915 [Caloramator sp. mosi_1]
MVCRKQCIFKEEDTDKAVEYWKKQREKIKEVEEGRKDREIYIKNRDEIEKQLKELSATAKTEKEKIEVMKFAWTS